MGSSVAFSLLASDSFDLMLSCVCVFQMSWPRTACTSVWQSCPPHRWSYVTAWAFPAVTLTTLQHTVRSSTLRSWPPSELLSIAHKRPASPPLSRLSAGALSKGKVRLYFIIWHTLKMKTAEKLPLELKSSVHCSL